MQECVIMCMTQDHDPAFKEYYIDCPVDSEAPYVGPSCPDMDTRIVRLRIPRALANYILKLQQDLAAEKRKNRSV
jgi:hypothetical protein